MLTLRSLLIFPVLSAAISPASRLEARPRTDVLVMKNGDRITCEIKKLERGQLLIKTDYTTGTVTVDWLEVERIESKQLFQVALSDGERYDGVISQERSTEKFKVFDQPDTLSVDRTQVVEMEQLGKSLLQQLDGGIDLGFSSTSSNNLTQMTVNASVSRRREKDFADLRGSSIFSRQADAPGTNRNNLTALYQRDVSRSWVAGATLDLLQSDGQQLDLRTTVGGFGGRYLFRTNRTEMLTAGGLVFNRERFSQLEGQPTSQGNAEGVIAAQLLLFRFDSTQFDTRFQLFPSITQSGRYWINFSTNMYLDLWGDLYLRFSFFDNFDSRPPVDTPGNDLGVTTSVG